MRTRESYVFDQPIGEYPGGHPTTFAVSADRRTYFAAFGARSGITLLVHFTPEGDVAFGSWLHTTTIRNVGQQGEALLARGWLKRAADALHPETLVSMGEVPGFNERPPTGDGRTTHVHGWFTHGTWALPLTVPPFLDSGTTVWDIREGIYITFPDGTCRLIPRRDHGAGYDEWEKFVGLFGGVTYPNEINRQGDLFVLSSGYGLEGMNAVEVKEGVTLDRHTVAVHDGHLVLEHPQHEPLNVSEGDWLVMLPGASHPFSRRVGFGD